MLNTPNASPTSQTPLMITGAANPNGLLVQAIFNYEQAPCNSGPPAGSVLSGTLLHQ